MLEVSVDEYPVSYEINFKTYYYIPNINNS